MLHSVTSLEERLICQTANVIQPSEMYFSHDYAELYEEKENGTTSTVYYESPAGKVEYTFIKRKIPRQEGNPQYYDITTAYGYGGPCILESRAPETLMRDFHSAFTKFCQEEKIITEFIRFHLFESEDVRKYFPGEVSLIGHHIVRDLKQPLTENFHKSVHSSVRKAKRKGLSASFDETGESLEDFLTIYQKTMDRNDANDFYYFDEEFFKSIQKRFPGKFVYANAWLDGKVVASFLNILGDRYAYAFLGGTLREYFNYEASTFLEYQLIEWLKENGISYYILGGGYRGDDGLYRYKKKFDQQGDRPFYIGKKVYDEDMYQKLTTQRANAGDFDPESNFFPLYRS